ncbi:MAG: glycosyltransferase family 4 protein, partial [Candidatus Wukongarchaeota archaeon]|nr:glycosyltransferase [Candidatus Wukongarchaeota archaeon]
MLINYEYPPIGGGAANATYHIGRCLTNYGHGVTVLTSSFKNKVGCRIEDGICVYRVMALRRYDSLSNMLEMFSYVVSASVALTKILKKHNINVMIVFFSFPCGPLGLLGKLICGVPY